MKSVVKAVAQRSRPGAALRASPYVSAAQTKALLAGSARARALRLAAADMLSVAEAANAANSTVDAIRRWISEGRVIALQGPRRTVRLPRWQFVPSLWEAIPQLAEALGTTEGWALLSFLETPIGPLGGRTPRQAIEQGDSAPVLEAAIATSF